MEYKERTYREKLARGRWQTFTVAFKETDLWIGVDPEAFCEEMPSFALQEVQRLRGSMEEYLQCDPGYARSLAPYTAAPEAPEILVWMSSVAARAGIGPMSAVAGAVAQRIGESLRKRFHTREVIVENGGDIYADIREKMDIAVFAGTSPLSGRVGFSLEADPAPLGICTSSGTVGPSLSFGKADAVMIVCHDCALADTYATAFANQILTPEDIDPCIGRINAIPEILGAICIKEDKIGISGRFNLKLWK